MYLTKQGERQDYNYIEIFVDEDSEIGSILSKKAYSKACVGSVAYVINSGNVYILNSDRQWVLQGDAGSSGGGSEGSESYLIII